MLKENQWENWLFYKPQSSWLKIFIRGKFVIFMKKCACDKKLFCLEKKRILQDIKKHNGTLELQFISAWDYQCMRMMTIVWWDVAHFHLKYGLFLMFVSSCGIIIIFWFFFFDFVITQSNNITDTPKSTFNFISYQSDRF